MPSNLPEVQKENWVKNEIVKPDDTNSWGRAINTLSKSVPIYASNGDFYTVQSYKNDTITLVPLTFPDGTENETPLTYLDGMNIIFKATFTNTGKCSVTVNELGTKQIKNIDNTLLKSDTITQGDYINLRYDKLQDCFYLIRSNSGGSGLEICDIGMALYVDETKGLRRYLNGQIVDINTNTQAFLNRLKDIQATNPDYFTTEDNWQSEATLNIDGCVYKFVLNYADDGETVVSVRLPKYPDYVEIDSNSINSTAPVAVYGTGKSLGLMSASGYGPAGSYVYDNTRSIVPSSFNNTSEPVSVGTTGGSLNSAFTFSSTPTAIGIDTSASRSGLTGTATIISSLKQTKLKLRYFIQIATGSETENNIINDIELNNPYSLFDSKYSDHELNNLSWLKSNGQWNAKAVYTDAYDKLLKVYNGTETVEGLSVKLSTEAYTDYDFVLNTSDETFRLPLLDGSEDLIGDNYNSSSFSATNSGYVLPINKNGQISIRIYGSVKGDVTVFKNNKTVGTFNLQSSIYRQGTITTQVVKGDKIKVITSTSDTTANCNYLFFEAKGNGSLYYYVGETVQNANLIDAGRIGEVLPSKADKAEVLNKLTNCLLEVPQRIKYTLVDGTLTIKAGSVVIVPYGTEDLTEQYPIGSTFLHSNYKVYDRGYWNGKFFILIKLVNDIYTTGSWGKSISGYSFLDLGNKIVSAQYSRFASGDTEPTIDGSVGLWYDTANNYCKIWNGTDFTTGGFGSLPTMSIEFSVSTGTEYKIGSVSQVFNGMGYIGSTIWVDKGVKGLIPNGRNADRTLNNIEFETNGVLTTTNPANAKTDLALIANNSTLSRLNLSRYKYDFETNMNYDGERSAYMDMCIIATYSRDTDGNVYNFQPKLPFRAVDYNDKSEISSWGMPSTKYIALTLGASGTKYTAPANGYFLLCKWTAASNQNASLMNNSRLYWKDERWAPISGGLLTPVVPAEKGDVVTLAYNATGKTEFFRFIYAQGEV